MKICFWIGNAFYRKAGTNKMVCTIANELCKIHEVTILITNKQYENSVFDYDQSINIKSVSETNVVYNRKSNIIRYINNKTGFFNNGKRIKLLKNSLYSKTKLKSIAPHFNKEKYDIIIATGSEILWLALMRDFISEKTKLIGWQHNSYNSYVTRKNVLFWKKEELLKKYIPNLDKLIVLNPYDKIDYFEKLQLHTEFIENPLTITSDVKTNYLNKNFIFVGRLNHQKGIDFLINSFYEFSKKNVEWNLLIVGEGNSTFTEKLINLIKSKKLCKRIKLIGFTTEVINYYLKSSIYLMTSRYEGWGLVVTEAMSVGLPIITFDITPMEYIIDHHKNGIVVGKYNTKKYAAAMLKLANDENMRREMSKSAIIKSNQFSLDNILQKWNKLFEDLF